MRIGLASASTERPWPECGAVWLSKLKLLLHCVMDPHPVQLSKLVVRKTPLCEMGMFDHECSDVTDLRRWLERPAGKLLSRASIFFQWNWGVASDGCDWTIIHDQRHHSFDSLVSQIRFHCCNESVSASRRDSRPGLEMPSPFRPKTDTWSHQALVSLLVPACVVYLRKQLSNHLSSSPTHLLPQRWLDNFWDIPPSRAINIRMLSRMSP